MGTVTLSISPCSIVPPLPRVVWDALLPSKGPHVDI